MSECTEACETMPVCSVCARRKAPRGRSVPMEACQSYCNWECEGYPLDPQVGHLWPGELREQREREPDE
jgi:hypothetical protein